MYPSSPSLAPSGGYQRPVPVAGSGRSAQRSPGRRGRRLSRQGLWTAVAVLVCAAVAATVVCLVWLPGRGTPSVAAYEATGDLDAAPSSGYQPGANREAAQDAAAKSLVRNAMVALESVYVDLRTFDPTTMTPAVLESIEPATTFIPTASNGAGTAPMAAAADEAVNYFGTATTYAVGTVSESGKTFGVFVDKGPGGGNTFYINGVAQDWTSESSPDDSSDYLESLTSDAEADSQAQEFLLYCIAAIAAAGESLGTFDSTIVTAEVLAGMEPPITLVAFPDSTAATAPTGLASHLTVNYFGTATMFAVGTVSETGRTFGFVVVGVQPDPAVDPDYCAFYEDGVEVQEWPMPYSLEDPAAPSSGYQPEANREAAQDALAKSLVRNAMTAIESAYVDLRTFDPTTMTPAQLMMIEPSIAFVAVASNSAGTAPMAAAADDAVSYFGTATTYAVGTASESGKTFGVVVDKGPGGGVIFYVNGVAQDW